MSKDKLIPELRFPEFKNEGEWEDKTLINICDITNGKANAQDHIEGGIYPLFDRSEVIKSSNEFIFDCESVIIPGEGMRFIPKYYAGKFNLHQRAYALKDFNCDVRFVYYSMMHRSWLLSQNAVQSTVLSLRLPILQEFPIEIPKNPKEQQKIASCLSSLDEVIAAHTQKLELLKAHKKGLMQNLFPQEGEKVPKYRFKEFEKDGEWEIKQLGVDKLIEIKGRIGYRGYTTEDIVSKGEGAISMSPSNIDENWNLNFEKSTYITWDKYEESPEIMLEDGFTVLVKTGSSYGKAAYIKNLIEKTTINPQLVVLKPKKIDSYFLYLLVINTSIQKQIQETVVGGAIPTLSQDSISKFEVLVAKKKEQEKIADCLLTLNQLIISQTEKIEQLKLHKKGLMQGLFPKIKE